MTNKSTDSDETPTNEGQSILARIRNYARVRLHDPQYTLNRYVVERFLARISASTYADKIVLRGATLYTIWLDINSTQYRATRDVDLLMFGSSGAADIHDVLADILKINVDDAVSFDITALKIEPRRNLLTYPGVNATCIAQIASSRTPIAIDIAFGEAVYPPAIWSGYPTILGQAMPHIRVYPREVVVAEKAHAIVVLGLSNTRVKDFYDIWMIARSCTFDAQILVETVSQTFERRQTKLPLSDIPSGLTRRFAENVARVAQWKRLRQQVEASFAPASLEDLVDDVSLFLNPLLLGELTNETWTPASGWKLRSDWDT